MAAANQERLADFFGSYPARRTVPMKAATRIFKGCMVGIDSSGNALPAGLLAGGTVRVVGVANATCDNASGAAGAAKVECAPGIFLMNNQGGDLVTAADVGAVCYVADDNTVARTSATSTRAVAGVVQAVEADGRVRVFFQ